MVDKNQMEHFAFLKRTENYLMKQQDATIDWKNKAGELATREPMLRFGHSSIHAWGVFADEDIAADEMIIEYRGELIGNAVTEMR